MSEPEQKLAGDALEAAREPDPELLYGVEPVSMLGSVQRRPSPCRSGWRDGLLLP
jgi:hypothetical protein